MLALQPPGLPPAVAAAYRAEVADRSARADAALQQLDVTLRSALDEARQGAAATLSGDERPAAHFEAAGARLEDGRGTAQAAADALSRLDAVLAVRGDRQPPLALSADDLSSIAAQLRDTAVPADGFADMRMATRAFLDDLRASLIALRSRQAAVALPALQRAAADLAGVRAWPGRLATLPIWMQTGDDLLRALRDVAAAQQAGDASREKQALATYAAVTHDATRADRALAIALAEGGASVSGTPLARLADALSKLDGARASVAPLVHPS